MNLNSPILFIEINKLEFIFGVGELDESVIYCDVSISSTLKFSVIAVWLLPSATSSVDL